MPDMERVIKWLEICIKGCDDSCPYKKECESKGGFTEPMRDALALLKAQEPVEPKMMEFVDKGLTWEKYGVPTCGVCGALLGDALFCPMCGRGVKWE